MVSKLKTVIFLVNIDQVTGQNAHRCLLLAYLLYVLALLALLAGHTITDYGDSRCFAARFYSTGNFVASRKVVCRFF